MDSDHLYDLHSQQEGSKSWNLSAEATLSQMAKARIRPSKTHFFQPVLPGYSKGLSMPIEFLRCIGGEKCEEAVLRSGRGKSWNVKIHNGSRFQEGWMEFAGYHDLRVGDFLVFRHEGCMVFHVMVFDATACEKEYPPLDVKKDHDDLIKNNEKRGGNKKSSMETPRVEARADSVIPTNPHFVATIMHYNFTHYIMNIPMGFARSNGLAGRWCKMILRGQKGRSWPVILRYKKSSGQVYIKDGWRVFSDANGLKKGDVCTFELVSTGKKYVMEVRISRVG